MSASVLRSVVRATAQALGSDWEVRLGSQEWSAFQRPWARVGWATAGTSTPHGARSRDHRRTVSVVAYATPGINGESSLIEAERVAGLLTDCFARGVDPAVVSSRDERRPHPLRLPLFDYSGTALHAPGPAEPVGFVKVVESPTIEALPDPAADSSYVVAATVRLGWSEGISRPANHPVEEVIVGAVEAVIVSP